MGGYEQNMVTTARLGSAYHGVIANFTKEGSEPRPPILSVCAVLVLMRRGHWPRAHRDHGRLRRPRLQGRRSPSVVRLVTSALERTFLAEGEQINVISQKTVKNSHFFGILYGLFLRVIFFESQSIKLADFRNVLHPKNNDLVLVL